MAGDPLKKGRYTNFGNKIGLFSNKTGNFICNSSEVVLNFPFKDTVLEAGMTKEDSSREERFLHSSFRDFTVGSFFSPSSLNTRFAAR